MSAPIPRQFTAKKAVRENVPVLIGLTGASGSGKTWSALRLATGIQQVTGGQIYGIDTEARRMAHYGDYFDFQHVEFKAPFGSRDYLAAIQWCVAQGAKTIIVDQISSEHEGPGGMLDFQEHEYERLGHNDKIKMLAWVKPKQARRDLINGILQLNANMIFCFRAKSVSKPIKVSGKTEVVPMGFEPIAGPEFIYELMVNCLLLPKAGGVPTWQSDNPGEAMAMKLPEQFKKIFAEKKPLDEDIGRQLAEWACGGAKQPQKDLALDVGEKAAQQGTAALQTWWTSLSPKDKTRLKSEKDRLKKIADGVSCQPKITESRQADLEVLEYEIKRTGADLAKILSQEGVIGLAALPGERLTHWISILRNDPDAGQGTPME